MNFIDSHCHLGDNTFFKKITKLIPEWKDKGITKIGAMATNIKTSKRIIELAEKNDDIIIPSIGRHPWGAHKVTKEHLVLFEQLISNKKNAIIGEIGLDYYFVKEHERQEKQVPLFKFFLQMSQKYNRSIMLHVTGAERDIYDILTTFNLGTKICCHWYSGPEKILKQLSDIGCFFTINPKYKNSRNHKKVLELIDLNRILTESDGPVKFQGKINSPSLIPTLVSEIACEIKENEKDLALQIYQNYLDFLTN